MVVPFQTPFTIFRFLQLVAAGKAALKATGNAVADETKKQTALASSSPLGVSTLTNGAEGLLSDAMSKAAEAQAALEGAVDDVGVRTAIIFMFKIQLVLASCLHACMCPHVP